MSRRSIAIRIICPVSPNREGLEKTERKSQKNGWLSRNFEKYSKNIEPAISLYIIIARMVFSVMKINERGCWTKATVAGRAYLQPIIWARSAFKVLTFPCPLGMSSRFATPNSRVSTFMWRVVRPVLGFTGEMTTSFRLFFVLACISACAWSGRVGASALRTGAASTCGCGMARLASPFATVQLGVQPALARTAPAPGRLACGRVDVLRGDASITCTRQRAGRAVLPLAGVMPIERHRPQPQRFRALQGSTGNRNASSSGSGRRHDTAIVPNNAAVARLAASARASVQTG